MEKITPFDGTVANKKDCRYIKGEFYKKNEQCFYIDGLWYRINSGYIAFDYEDQSWKLIKNSSMINGIVNYNENTEEVILGYFTPNQYTNINVVVDNNGTTYPCINEKVLKGHFHIDLRSLNYVHISKKVSSEPYSGFRFGASNTYSNELVYNVRTFQKDKLAAISKYTEEYFNEYLHI